MDTYPNIQSGSICDIIATIVPTLNQSGSNDVPSSGSVVLTNSSDAVKIKVKGRGKNPNSVKNLIPRKKGDPPLNPTGISGPRIKTAIMTKLIDMARVDKIAETIVAGAESGEDKKISVLLALTGELVETPTLSINHNTLAISTDDIQEILKQINP